MRDDRNFGYHVLVAMTGTSIAAVPVSLGMALWTGEWRYLVVTGLCALFLWRLAT